MRVAIAFLLVAAVAVAMPSTAGATLLISADFGSYADGNLVGQDGWGQLGAASSVPLTVSSGTVTIPGGQLGDNQDAWHDNSAGVVPPPVSGTTSIYYGLGLTVNSAPVIDSNPYASPSYFAAVYNGSGATGFANARLSAIDNSADVPGTFKLAARITGQSGDPFTYGTPLTYGTPYNVVVRTDMVAGAGNDFLEVFVDGVSNFTNSIGTGTDPTGMGSFVISQFASTTVGNAGVTIGRVRMADNYAQAAAPEPTSLVLAFVTAVGCVSVARCSRRRAA